MSTIVTNPLATVAPVAAVRVAGARRAGASRAHALDPHIVASGGRPDFRPDRLLTVRPTGFGHRRARPRRARPNLRFVSCAWTNAAEHWRPPGSLERRRDATRRLFDVGRLLSDIRIGRRSSDASTLAPRDDA